jgi:hypothetical protein
VLSHAGVSCDYQADLEACSGDLAEFCRFAQAAQGLDPYFTLNVRQFVVTARCVAVFAIVARTR